MITIDIRSFTINWTLRLRDVQMSVWLEHAVNEFVMLCTAKNEHTTTDGSTIAAELNINVEGVEKRCKTLVHIRISLLTYSSQNNDFCNTTCNEFLEQNKIAVNAETLLKVCTRIKYLDQKDRYKVSGSIGSIQERFRNKRSSQV